MSCFFGVPEGEISAAEKRQIKIQYEKYLKTQDENIMEKVNSALGMLRSEYVDSPHDIESYITTVNREFELNIVVNNFISYANFNNAYKNNKLDIPYIKKVENHWYRNLDFGGVGTNHGGTVYVGNGGSTASENAPLIWKFLITKGFTEEGAAGLMGNLEAESGLMPNNVENKANTASGYSDSEFTDKVNSGEIGRDEFIRSNKISGRDSGLYGYGLAQWTYVDDNNTGRKANFYDYMKQNNYAIDNLQGQLDFLFLELENNYHEVYNTLKTTRSVGDASNIVLHKFESPADQSVTVER